MSPARVQEKRVDASNTSQWNEQEKKTSKDSTSSTKTHPAEETEQQQQEERIIIQQQQTNTVADSTNHDLPPPPSFDVDNIIHGVHVVTGGFDELISIPINSSMALMIAFLNYNDGLQFHIQYTI